MINENELSDLAKERLAICKQCLLFKDDPERGPICNPAKYMSPDGKEVSYFKKEGWIKGCGCLINFRVIRQNSHCVAKKW